MGSGAGREGFLRWVDVYRRIQTAGKALQLSVTLEELPYVFETLSPHGIWFAHISGINDKQTADDVLRKIGSWVVNFELKFLQTHKNP